jgi:calcineurin-like phosphoesterase family protein/fibronectin type III domain protein
MRSRTPRRFRTAATVAAAISLVAALVLQGGPAAAADTTPPSTPKNLHVTSSSPSAVGLAWNASTDDVEVTAYIVKRDGVKIASVRNPPVTSYTDASVAADEAYTYRVRARDAAGNRSKPSKAVTASTAATAVVAAAGDIACDPSDPNYHGGTGTSTACRQKYTSDILVNGDFDAVLALGDEQYDSGSLSDFNTVYDPTWGRVKSITYPVVGNHEYGQSGASGYFDYYGSVAGEPGKGYYSFDLATWHIIAINSNCDRISGGCGTNSPEEQWLRADLAAHSNECTLAMWHHGRYSSGHDGDNTFMQPMWADLVDGGAEILLSGHSHDYERFAPQDENGNLDTTNGVRQFIVGTGGAFFTGLGTSFDDNSQAAQNNTYGILKLTLRADAYDWQFVPEAGKTYSDSGTTSCH